MIYRRVSGIVFAAIIFIELVIYLSGPTPLRNVAIKTNEVVPVSSSASSDLKKFVDQKLRESGMRIETDYDAQRERSIQFSIVIGVTVIIGAVLTFSLPLKKVRD
jgi:hypothetical protein